MISFQKEFLDLMGFVDDIYISVLVLKNIENDLGMGYLESLWKGDNDLSDV